jgi:hypothetical protein
MAIVDADTHVIECEDTWSYLEGDEKRFRPKPVTTDSGDKYWLVDGHIIDREVGDASIPLAVRELRDLEGRKRMMAEVGVDTQILYPTFLLAPPSNRPEIVAALARSYNRWLADTWRRDHAFRWVIAPAVEAMDETLAELDFGKANGACGVFLRGVEGDRLLADPWFFPLYEKAQAMDLPICIHVGNGSIAIRDILYGDRSSRVLDVFYTANMPVLAAFHLLITAGVPELFPRLRFAFVEAGAEWIPYMLGEAIRRQETMTTRGHIEDARNALREKRLFVTCRTDNNLPAILEWGSEDNLMIGTDFGHADASTELGALQTLRRQGTIPEAVVDKIVTENPRTLYAL